MRKEKKYNRLPKKTHTVDGSLTSHKRQPTVLKTASKIFSAKKK